MRIDICIDQLNHLEAAWTYICEECKEEEHIDDQRVEQFKFDIWGTNKELQRQILECIREAQGNKTQKNHLEARIYKRWQRTAADLFTKLGVNQKLSIRTLKEVNKIARCISFEEAYQELEPEIKWYDLVPGVRSHRLPLKIPRLKMVVRKVQQRSDMAQEQEAPESGVLTESSNVNFQPRGTKRKRNGASSEGLFSRRRPDLGSQRKKTLEDIYEDQENEEPMSSSDDNAFVMDGFSSDDDHSVEMGRGPEPGLPDHSPNPSPPAMDQMKDLSSFMSAYPASESPSPVRRPAESPLIDQPPDAIRNGLTEEQLRDLTPALTPARTLFSGMPSPEFRHEGSPPALSEGQTQKAEQDLRQSDGKETASGQVPPLHNLGSQPERVPGDSSRIVATSDLAGALRSVGKGEMLNSTAIELTLKCSPTDDFQYIDAAFFDAEPVQILARPDSKSWDMRLPFICPINVSHHWTMACINPYDGVIDWYTSLSSKQYEDAAVAKIRAFETFIKRHQDFAGQKYPWAFNIKHREIQQDDFTSCGVFSVVWALATICKRNMPPYIDTDLWRQSLQVLLDDAPVPTACHPHFPGWAIHEDGTHDPSNSSIIARSLERIPAETTSRIWGDLDSKTEKLQKLTTDVDHRLRSLECGRPFLEQVLSTVSKQPALHQNSLEALIKDRDFFLDLQDRSSAGITETSRQIITALCGSQLKSFEAQIARLETRAAAIRAWQRVIRLWDDAKRQIDNVQQHLEHQRVSLTTELKRQRKVLEHQLERNKGNLEQLGNRL